MPLKTNDKKFILLKKNEDIYLNVNIICVNVK
jgi:hypothetical protein